MKRHRRRKEADALGDSARVEPTGTPADEQTENRQAMLVGQCSERGDDASGLHHDAMLGRASKCQDRRTDRIARLPADRIYMRRVLCELREAVWSKSEGPDGPLPPCLISLRRVRCGAMRCLLSRCGRPRSYWRRGRRASMSATSGE